MASRSTAARFAKAIFLDAGEIEQLFLKRKAPERQSFMRRLLGI